MPQILVYRPACFVEGEKTEKEERAAFSMAPMIDEMRNCLFRGKVQPIDVALKDPQEKYLFDFHFWYF